MDKNEFIQKIGEIGTCEDDAQRRTLLAEMQDDISKVFDSNVELTKQNTNLTSDNENLRSANMKLFLRVGEQKDESQANKDRTGAKTEEKEKRSFENLFNEKGGLK